MIENRPWLTIFSHTMLILGIAVILFPLYVAFVAATLDKEAWGFDHGSWGVLIKMYPDADIPMVQLSIDSSKPAAWHFEMGRKLAALRDEGIMLVASGSWCMLRIESLS